MSEANATRSELETELIATLLKTWMPVAGPHRDVVERLAASCIQTSPDREIVALIANLQRMGVDGRVALSSDGAASAEESR